LWTTGNGGPNTPPFTSTGLVVECVENFKFLGVHIAKDVHTNPVVMRVQQYLFPLRRLK
jgi:hypothetical protein